jgi:2Fe-2S type ferredoxin
VLNIRGTGACNSECVFCIEKFNPTHRPMPKADATRQLILNSGGAFDMLFFAAGEPTIHPKLFEYVELAKRVGFTCFGMSSHFRTFADPRFALKILQAGFEYFDIALHAADAASQLEVNPIGDDGRSLDEALKGLAVILRLADVLGIRVSVTHKIVISRLNVTRLEPIFRSTYERGVRHFIFQPVRAMGLRPEIQAKLAISEEEMVPYLNDLLRRTEGLGAVLKPYGFSRQGLFSGNHVESEQNRVKNIYGKARQPRQILPLPETGEGRPRDGRHWVEVTAEGSGRSGFASDGSAPVLDDALRHGLGLPFGCRMGSCGMCCGMLMEGRVDQSSQIFLTEEQMEAGYVLLCQARPLSDVVVRLCTDDEIDQL